MRTIHKYPLQVVGVQNVDMPRGAKILCVQMQGHHMCLWAEVNDAETSMFRRVIEVVGTGNPKLELLHTRNIIKESDGVGEWSVSESKYIGTVLMADGALVWHVYELVRSDA